MKLIAVFVVKVEAVSELETDTGKVFGTGLAKFSFVISGRSYWGCPSFATESAITVLCLDAAVVIFEPVLDLSEYFSWPMSWLTVGKEINGSVVMQKD